VQTRTSRIIFSTLKAIKYDGAMGDGAGRGSWVEAQEGA